MTTSSWIDLVYYSLEVEEWSAAIRIAAFVFVGTEFLKRLWRRVSSSFNNPDVWFLSTGCGLVGGYALWPPIGYNSIDWWIAGLIISGAVSFAHRWALIGIRWKFPALAAIISGERRHDVEPPPGGVDRRK